MVLKRDRYVRQISLSETFPASYIYVLCTCNAYGVFEYECCIIDRLVTYSLIYLHKPT